MLLSSQTCTRQVCNSVFLRQSRAAFCHDNKPRPSEHSQVPLTAECSSPGCTRFLSKQSADRLINRRGCKGARRSLFSHPANTRSFYSRGLLCADPVTVWICHFAPPPPSLVFFLLRCGSGNTLEQVDLDRVWEEGDFFL